MKTFVLFCCFAFLTFTTFGQSLESLVGQLSNLKEDSNKVRVLLKIVNAQLQIGEAEKSYLYGTMALELAKKLSNRRLEAESYSALGNVFAYKKDYSGATNFHLQSLVLFETYNDKPKVGAEHLNLADVYKNWRAFQKAKEHYVSALQVFNDGKDSKSQLRSLKGLADCAFALQDVVTAEQNYAKILSISNSQNNIAEASAALQDLSICAKEKKDFEGALKYTVERYNLLKTKENTLELALVANNIGFLYKQTKNNTKAAEYFNEALGILNKINNAKKGSDAVVLDNMGVVQVNLGDFKKAKNYFRESLAIHENAQNFAGIVASQNYLAACDYVSSQNELALEEIEKAIEIGEKNKTLPELAESYKILSEIYSAMSDFKRSQDAYKKHQEIKQQIEADRLKQADMVQEALIQAEKKESEFKLLMADKENKELALKQLKLEGDKRENELKLQSQQLALLTSDKELQNTLINNQKLEKEKTLQALQITESRLQEEQRNRQITDLEKEKELQAITIKQKELEGKERQKAFELVEADRKLKAQELQEEKTITQYSFYVYGLIGIIFMVIAFAFYQKQKVNRILGEQNAAIKAQQTEIKIKNEELLSSEEELRQNNEELLATHETMREQKEQLEIVNTEIAAINMNLFDSIRYAERIQSAMLPNIALFQQLFGGAMIFFKPKDIVSGDFYWAAQVNDMNFVAVADCTGHGVPGAFMSMIGSTLLNEIINQKNIYEPERILRRLNMAIMQALRQGEKENRDGMDICLMRVTPSENENKLNISFCAAKRPLYLVENGNFIELKGDRKSIGGSQNDETEFVDKNIVVSKGTIAYLTTDGLADQNGPKRQKLGSGAVKEFINSVYHLPFEKQNVLFDEMLKNHMKGEKQRDDITVLAVKI